MRRRRIALFAARMPGRVASPLTLVTLAALALLLAIFPQCVSYKLNENAEPARICDPTAPYPSAPSALAVGAAVPDVELRDAEDKPHPLHELYEPCASEPRLVVLRVTAAWCGPCEWHAKHTRELFDGLSAPTVRLIDVLLTDVDNVPADAIDAAEWQKHVDAPGLVTFDPQLEIRRLLTRDVKLPFYVVVDARRMVVTSYLANPPPEHLAHRIRDELAVQRGEPRPPLPKVALVDGRFSRDSWDLIREMVLPTTLPPDPTNRVADDPKAAVLGRKLYFDTGLLPVGDVSCSTCHDPSNNFASLSPVAIGRGQGERNGPAVMLAGHARWQFWDGRADTLWAQALGPFENPVEFDSTRAYVVHQVAERYGADYAEIFGAMPDVSDRTRFPQNAKPGMPAWSAMSEGDKEILNRAFSNVGKAIAAYERSIKVKPNALDRYIAGQPFALTDAQKDGLRAFVDLGCVQCHYGPRLTDDSFHVIRMPTARRDDKPDPGRSDGISKLLASEFRGDGRYSDAPQAAARLSRVRSHASLVGAFKTPGLRGITRTKPFGHGGNLPELDDLVAHYARGGLPEGDPRTTGDIEPWVPSFGEATSASLVSFLKVLSGDTE